MPKPAQRTKKAASPQALDARDAAYRHLSAHAERYPDLLPGEINTGGLDARDASLSHAIVDASVRRWRTLEYILEAVSGHKSHELEPRMRAVLLGGAAQLLLLDRVPPHAVLDESVSWAKRFIRSGAGGMVNAVLRKVARTKGKRIDQSWDHFRDAIPLSEGGSLALDGIELPENGRRRLGIACSLPDALLRRWELMWEDPTGEAMHTLCKPPTIVCTKYASISATLDQLTPHNSPHHRVFDGDRQSLIALLSEHSDLWVQDPASTATLESLPVDLNPERIVDLCAGQGTKTRQLRAMFPDAQILACEIEPTRLRSLKTQFKSDPGVRVVAVADLDERVLGSASLVLADVPCSNTGVLARRIEARSRPIDRQLKRLISTQRDILRTARSMLERDGLLVYATCSVESDENEAQAQWASQELGLGLVEQQRVETTGAPGTPACTYRDASFAAYLRANDESEQI